MAPVVNTRLAWEPVILAIILACMLLVVVACKEATKSSPIIESTVAQPTIIARTQTSSVTTIPSMSPDTELLNAQVSITLLSKVAEIVGVHNPVYMEAEVVGRGMQVISQIAGRREDDGRYRVFEIVPLQPARADKYQNDTWRAGAHTPRRPERCVWSCWTMRGR